MPVDCGRHVAEEQRAGIASVNRTLALIVGVLLLTLPYWYTPVFAINIY